MIEALIFDLDGTLVHLPVDYDKLFNEFKSIMHVEDVRPVIEVVCRTDESTKKKIFKVWDKAEIACLPNVSVNEEGMGLYSDFASRPKALVTFQGKKAAHQIIKNFKLSFINTFTREDSLNRVEQLKRAIEELKVPASKILFAGDSENDEISAKNVGCLFHRITWKPIVQQSS